MSIYESIISAIIQGVTEFLPVSSSGHVIILSRLFDYKIPGLFSQIYLHFGSLLAVIFVFRKDILRIFRSDRQLVLYIFIGVIPILLIALIFGKTIQPAFSNVKLAGYLLILNGIWLLIGHFKQRFGGLKSSLTPGRSLIIGIAQVLALFPGISRSGMTICAAMLLGIGRIEAYRFSFLLFIPVAVCALAYDKGALMSIAEAGVLSVVVGTIVAFFVSILALKVLYAVVNRSKLYLFGIYCFIMGALTAIL